MKAIFRSAMWVALLTLLCVPAVAAQQQGQQQQPPKQPAPPAAPAPQTPAQPETPPVNPEEEAAYKAFEGVPRTDSTRSVEAGEDFIKKYPESRYRGIIYSRLVTAYLSMEQVDKMYIAGEKALELNPDNVDVLSRVAFAVPRRLNPSDLDREQKLQKCEKYAKHAIELLTAMPKPEALDEASFIKAKNGNLSMAHGGLAVVYFHRQRYMESAGELEQAIQLSTTPDPADYYILGLAYQQAKRSADAATAFGHCGEMAGPLQAECKKNQDVAKKQAATQLVPPKP